MNKNQRLILIAFLVVTAAMMLFPPFQVVIEGKVRNLGYGYVLNPPLHYNRVSGEVNLQGLLLQWLAALAVALAAWIGSQRKSDEMSNKRQLGDPERKGLSARAVFFSLRLVRAILFLWCVVQAATLVIFVVNWIGVGETGQETMILAAAKTLLVALLWFGVLSLRFLVNWLHKRWYGIPHPSMEKRLSA